MLLTTFDGTHRPGLLDAFRRSGAGYSLIELTSPNIEIYKNILLELFKKLACYPVEAKALCDVRNSRMWGQYTIVLSSTVCNWQLQYSTFPPLQMVYIFPESDLREQKKGVGRCLDVACEDSCISNYPRYIKRIHYESLRQTGTSWINLLHLIEESRQEPSWRQNEKCDIVIILLRLLYWHYNNPSRTTFTLKDVFGSKGPTSMIELKVPGYIINFDSYRGPTVLSRKFDLLRDLGEGAYIGCGNGEFADSWVVFKKARSAGAVTLTTESKRRAKAEPLTAEYFNKHKEKVKTKLAQRPFVFMMVADMLGDKIEADEDEIVIAKDNMKDLYGKWLAQHRHFWLSHYEYIH
ncbi:hypothetical protein BC937DRAFT_94575 [Endogone sp. FLAS-F59071]|nr:hypothetical protein BC937DRAFT_94575 [Endogone sp. FLAS-F59071]|eukprot:RUS20692.1 hypothetical protein BC937DRAFT_94575 [Endogone sp. FLAS-F59071]